jgi:hypothetical protein
MLLYVSGGETGAVSGGEFDIGPPAAFEFAEAGGSGADAHRGSGKRDTTLESELPEIVSHQHRLGPDGTCESGRYHRARAADSVEGSGRRRSLWI